MSAPTTDVHWARFLRDPDDRPCFELLEERLFMDSDWERLCALYRRRREAPDLAEQPAERARLSLRLGQVLEDRMRDTDAAIQTYTEAVRLDPNQHKALAHLRRLYAARRSWEAVLQIGEQQALLAESSEARARILAEMGDVWLRELGDQEQAESLYARARAESGDAAEVQEPTDEGVVRAAWLAAARGETDAAMADLYGVLERDPTSIEALDTMLTVLDNAERHAEMPPVLERRASLAADPETRGVVLVRLGQIREQLGDPSEARDAYERSLAAHPSHAGARDALIGIHRASGDWSALCKRLESRIEDSQSSARVEDLCELAEVLEQKFEQPEAAREQYESALELSPEHTRAREGLLRLGVGEAQGAGVGEAQLTLPELDDEIPASEEPRGSRIVGVLERKLAAHDARGEGDSAEAIGIRLRIAELRAGELCDPGGAVALLEPLLDRDETLLDAAPALSSLYEQLGRQLELIILCENAARLSEPREQRIYWYRRAADTARVVGEPERAISCYQELLARYPDDHGARAALCDLFRSRGDRESLARLLRDEIGRTGESRELEVRLELADLCEAAGDVEVLHHLRRCLELEPRREDLFERAFRACELHGGALAQLDLVEHAALSARADRDRAALLARRGNLLADALHWKEEAAESWRAALEIDPEQAIARQRLSSAAPA